MKQLLLGLMVAAGLTSAASAQTFTIYNNSGAVIDIQWQSKNYVDVTSSHGRTDKYFPGEKLEGIGVPTSVTLTVEGPADLEIWLTPTWTQYGSTYYKVGPHDHWKVTYTGTVFQLWKEEVNNYTGPIPATDLSDKPATNWKNVQDAIKQPFNY